MSDTISASRDGYKERQLLLWQRRLLPFVMAAIVLMAVFFFVSSIVQLARLNEAVSFRPDSRVVDSIAAFERANPAAVDDGDYIRWKTLALLEERVIGQRYAQVNSTLLLRAWTRHLGFMTGMILALVGAIFVLAKLSESETRLSLEGPGAKGALATSSPGLVLAVLGAVLMVVSLTVQFEFSTRDVPVYLGHDEVPVGEMPPPPMLQEQEGEESVENRAELPDDESSPLP